MVIYRGYGTVQLELRERGREREREREDEYSVYFQCKIRNIFFYISFIKITQITHQRLVNCLSCGDREKWIKRKWKIFQ